MSLFLPQHPLHSEARKASRSAVGSARVMSLSLRERLGEGEGVESSFDIVPPSDQPLTPLTKGEGGRRSRLVSVVGFSLLLAACGKTPETAKAPTPAPTPKAEIISATAMEAELASALAEDPKKKVAAEKDALADKAEDIISKYPNKTATELLNVPEVNESLKVALTKLGQDKGLQNKINSTVELAARMKGLEGTPGSVRLDMDISKYDDPQKSRMLQAVLSEDPKKIVNFIVEEIGEASPELSYGGAERASNGVSIKENTPPAK